MRNNYYLSVKSLVFFLIVFTSLSACKKEKDNTIYTHKPTTAAEFTQFEILSQKVVLNPSGYAPLTAQLNLETAFETKAVVRVVGKHGAGSDIIKEYNEYTNMHTIPVLGLYADYDNIIELTLYNKAGENLGSSAITLTTEKLIADLPKVKIDVPAAGGVNEFFMVSYLAVLSPTNPNSPFAFDSYGDIRWFLDYRTHPSLSKVKIQDGIEILRNGNPYFGDAISNAIYEINYYGDVLNTWPLSGTGYKFHHQVLEKPDGNFLLSVHNLALKTVEDHVIEVNRNSKQVSNVWDLRNSLQMGRDAMIADIDSDWVHVNAVEYSANDNCILVSGRHQGVIKLDYSNNVKWIMSPHRGWGKAGDGTDLTKKLLHPLDNAYNKIMDTAVLAGAVNHKDFEWNWYQHATKIQPNGHITMFDNGETRNFKDVDKYSRALEVEIDEVNMTVKQVWQYGKQRGAETWSKYISDVDYDYTNGTVVFAPGGILGLNGGSNYSKVVEVTANTANVVFEATMYPPNPKFGVVAHRVEKVSFISK